MASMESAFPFKGPLGNISSYKNRLTRSWIVRTKGGPSKHQVKTYPSCQGIRDQNVEFPACGMASTNMFIAIKGVKHLTDFVLAGEFTKIIKAIQCMDTVHLKGRRDILFSSNRQFLDGFQLNSENPFDGVLSSPVTATIVRNESRAIVQLPEILPGINFRNPWTNSSSFRFIVCVGLIHDILYNDGQKRYLAAEGRGTNNLALTATEWMPAGSKHTGQTIELGLQQGKALDDAATMIVSVGMEFGTNSYNGIQPAKYIGCAKFVAVG